ncbi:hypothetical protein T11_15851 [Trichinella zimbabwensis]|uniref:Uncharacterized protein n=1 Tax=Trichinella zimbabwensis TaxID=268475 RepID=A0A0V1GYV6_9BILA|nr:hypothetical protein T11_15080 [Trichinella zimbabwensis]KRZ07151.1 hypothetical protein T11_15851 [Trichinella zimbabwensis]
MVFVKDVQSALKDNVNINFSVRMLDEVIFFKTQLVARFSKSGIVAFGRQFYGCSILLRVNLVNFSHPFINISYCLRRYVTVVANSCKSAPGTCFFMYSQLLIADQLSF